MEVAMKYWLRKNLIWILYVFFVVIAMTGFKLFAGATRWWQHIIHLLISLWLGCGVGALGEPESSWEPDGHP
jgi:hypothetical protein